MSLLSSRSETFSATVRTMKPEPGRAHRLDDVAQPAPLLVGGDAPRDADVIDRRHEHQVTAGQRDVAGRPRALGADRLLGHLDDDLLALFQQVLDAGAAAGTRRVVRVLVLVGGRAAGLARQQTLEVVGRAAHVRDVQVRALLEADVDERRLHPGEHALDPSLVDVAGDPTLALALDVELAQVPVLDQRDPGLRAVGVDYEEAAMRHPDEARCPGAAPGRGGTC